MNSRFILSLDGPQKLNIYINFLGLSSDNWGCAEMNSNQRPNPHQVIWKGETVTIWSISYRRRYPSLDFINELSDKDRISLLAIFRLLDSMLAGFRHPQKFKKLLEYDQMTFLELKSGQIRIGCFWQPNFHLYLTHGFLKKNDSWPEKEILMLKHVYLAWKNWG